MGQFASLQIGCIALNIEYLGLAQLAVLAA